MQRHNAAKTLRKDATRAQRATSEMVAEEGRTPLLPEDGGRRVTGESSSFFERQFHVGTGANLRTTVEEVPNGRPAKIPTFWSPATDARAILNLIVGSWMNILLVLCPLGVASAHFNWGATTTFCLNFLGIIPLALILGDVTEDLALRSGEVIGGLVNATFGNVVELILSIVALSKKTPALNAVAGLSNLGSILSNLLLVLGCCFFFGGMHHKIQTFNALANQVCNSLLFLAVVALVLPSAAVYLPDVDFSDAEILNFSRIISVLLLFTYLAYLYFQLVSHHDLFSASSAGGGGVTTIEEGSNEEGADGDDEDEEQPALTVTAELSVLLAISIIVAMASELITGSIEDMAKSSGLTTKFLSIVLLPLAGNAVEHITAVMVAMKNKMDLALGIAIGSSIQIALFVLPTCVLAAWGMGNPFSLQLSGLGTIGLALAIIHANFITNAGKSHYLMGIQLICSYLLISTAFLFTD